MHKILEVKDLSFKYGSEYIFKDVSFDVEDKEFLGVIGPNGGGKSTLAKLMLGLLKPDSGSLKWNMEGKIGYVAQNTNINLDFPISVSKVVEMGFLRSTFFGVRLTKIQKECVEKILKDLKLYDLRNEKIGFLSGGQRQKVFIARALVSKPKVLILDEPTSNIDAKSQVEIYRLLKEINNTHTIIVISHDISITLEYATRILHVNRAVLSHEVSRDILKHGQAICEVDMFEKNLRMN
ncbi:ABC transporter ATP-binding protein [Helicobacter sp. 11S02629-2]|uniref:metal ABC transporter ATP-binding protein n=1 Tax=Helicobacter sp. 11S02629-2 TaxID=1476195 RepID=UPI000BA5E2CE|nr:ABC transporter ATP-binding protein [Helicobacter sp. 11S02629-2]PAF45920.1 hypothetical protein BKH40_00470 [Helicobacter sp. 11S02629-2]